MTAIPSRSERPYANPYAAGAALGLVLLASYWIAGRGLGASGAFASTAAGTVALISPQRAASSAYFARYVGGDGPWHEWLLLEIGGVFIGGFVSAFLAGRIRRDIERGPRISPRARLAFAFGGGALMGLGAALARGCTSGLALSGGALLSVGAWLFIAAAFAAAYAIAFPIRRAWR